VLAAIGAALVVLAVAAATSVLVLGGEEHFADGTPERTVQRYLEAIEDRDVTAATALVSEPVLDRCGLVPPEPITQRGTASLRATLERSDIRETTATVFVRVNEVYRDAPLGISDPTRSITFELVMVGGEWRFAQMPWPLFCAFPRSTNWAPDQPWSRHS